MKRNFLSAAAFNAVVDPRKANCFAFALGLTEPGGIYDLPRCDEDGCRLTIDAAFKRRAEYNGIQVRQVETLDDTEKRVAFILFGWYPYGDFHVVRKNRNGSFEEKPDWIEPARLNTWDEIRKEYPERYYVFVLAE